MSIDIKKKLRKERRRTYLARDFDSFKSDLLRYAKTYFPDKIQDFSEASFGGLLLDMAAMVGDTMSFYLDHQFNELNPGTAVESKNIMRHLRAAGVKITGAAPAVVDLSIYIEVPSELAGLEYRPMYSALPVVLGGSVFAAKGGVKFNLVEDLDFAELTRAGNLKAKIKIATTNADGSPATYYIERSGICISGEETTQTFKVPNFHKPFRKITLLKENVSDIISIRDSSGNEYFEVDSLSQDVVFKAIPNVNEDSELVEENMEIFPCPYRYIKKFNAQTRLSTVTFGGGDAETLDNDIIPDPSELALPLYGKKTMSRFSIDPSSLLKTHTLGIAPLNTTISVTYRFGGGIAHNVGVGAIRTIDKLNIIFRSRVDSGIADEVRASIDINNKSSASGGAPAPTLNDLKAQIPATRQLQSRVVTKQDMLSRIYTMPPNFGRVYRAGVRSNPNNPLASQLFIICRNSSKQLIIAPDALKKNLRLYLNEFRLISDAFDVLDAQVINFSVKFAVVTDPKSNKNAVVQNCISRLKKVLTVENFQVDQPIMISDIVNVLINTDSVLGLTNLQVNNIRGSVDNRMYSDISFNVEANMVKGMIVPPHGGIFELRYPDFDVVGSAS